MGSTGTPHPPAEEVTRRDAAGGPLVSVIVPCFNQGSLLRQTLESVRRQTYPHWECIVVDDGSTDTTEQVSNEYARSDARFRCVRQANQGSSAARNEGLRLAVGDLIQFLDADDLLEPEKLQIQVASLADAPPRSVALCDYRYGHGPGASETLRIGELDRPRFNGTDPLLELIERWETDLSIAVSAFVFDASLFREPALQFDASLPTHEDWDCWLRIFGSGVHVVHTRQELAVYRLNPDSKSTNIRRMWAGMQMVCDKHRRTHPSHSVYARAFARKRREMGLIYATRMLRASLSRRAPWLLALYRSLPWSWQQSIRFRLGISR
jgi:glycosyltransferase involved in cell wall biosynthesis